MPTASGLRINPKNGIALLDNCPADILAAAGTGAQIKVYDSLSRYLSGIIGAVGSSEGLSAELIGNISFDDNSWWTFDANWSVGSGVATSNGSNGFIKSPALTGMSSGYSSIELVKVSTEIISRTSGQIITLYDGWGDLHYGSAIGVYGPYYAVWRGNNTIIYSVAFNGSVDNLTMKRVIAPSSSGVTILDAVGGNQNWASKNDNFTYNAASYTYELISGHPAIKRFGGVPYCTPRVNVW